MTSLEAHASFTAHLSAYMANNKKQMANAAVENEGKTTTTIEIRKIATTIVENEGMTTAIVEIKKSS